MASAGCGKHVEFFSIFLKRKSDCRSELFDVPAKVTAGEARHGDFFRLF
jgi:hypothetical protein